MLSSANNSHLQVKRRYLSRLLSVREVPTSKVCFYQFGVYYRAPTLLPWSSIHTSVLRLIHITAFSACVCGRLLHCSAEIEKFLSLRWRSLLRNPQTTAASVNQPLTVRYLGPLDIKYIFLPEKHQLTA